MDRGRAATAEEHSQGVRTGRRRADRDPVHLIGVNRDQVARHPPAMRQKREAGNAPRPMPAASGRAGRGRYARP